MRFNGPIMPDNPELPELSNGVVERPLIAEGSPEI